MKGKNMGVSTRLVAATLSMIAAAGMLVAQTAGAGALTGTVTDPSGAVVPSVSVTITSLNTGQFRFNFDMTLGKTTRVGGIHENATLQFRAEFFNRFNHPQSSNPTLTDNSAATFGQITSTSVNPRLVQLALKYVL
jgi:hypothetical protein